MSGSTDIGGIVGELSELIRAQTGADAPPFNPGCDEQRIAELEARLGLTLPDDYREFLRHADGQSDPFELTFPPSQLALLPAAEVLEVWEGFVEDEEEILEDLLEEGQEVMPVLYHPRRVPVGYNEMGGIYLCLDFIPGPAGRAGQLVANFNEIDSVVLEPSFGDYLRRCLTMLRHGLARIEERPDAEASHSWVSADGEYFDHAVYERLRRGASAT